MCVCVCVCACILLDCSQSLCLCIGYIKQGTRLIVCLFVLLWNEALRMNELDRSKIQSDRLLKLHTFVEAACRVNAHLTLRRPSPLVLNAQSVYANVYG